MKNHRSTKELENIIFIFVLESKAQAGNDLPFQYINKSAKEKYNLTSYELFIGYRSLRDKGLITDEIEIADGFFDYFNLKNAGQRQAA